MELYLQNISIVLIIKHLLDDETFDQEIKSL